MKNYGKSLLSQLVSLRAKRSNLIIERLLRRFAPRNDTLLTSHKLYFDDNGYHNLDMSDRKYNFKYIMFMIYLSVIFTSVCFLIKSGFSQEQFVYDSKYKRDPFMPLIDKEGRFLSLERQTTEAKYDLEGVIYDPQGVSFAIINGTVLEIGDAVNEYKLLTIKEASVELSNDAQTLILELKKED